MLLFRTSAVFALNTLNASVFENAKAKMLECGPAFAAFAFDVVIQ
jgi:hypothetical protein